MSNSKSRQPMHLQQSKASRQSEEPRYAMQSPSGMTVWVPESKVEQYKNGTLPKWSKEGKERMIKEIVNKVYGRSET